MHNTDKMKVSELQKIIRTAINEVINEDASADKAAQQAKIAAIDKEIQALQKTKTELSKETSPLAEDQVDEMANVAVRYELAPDAAAADFTGKKARIITAMQATEEPMSKIDVASALGYDKQNPINADFMALVANGTIIPSGTQSAPRLTRPASEPTAAAADDTGIEGGVDRDLSDEEVDAMFAKVMKGDEEEPEIDDVEKADVSGISMSDEEYEAFMQYTDLENRLAKIKSDILKSKRSKGVAGDISDRPSDELQRLRDLKDKVQSKMDSLLASSDYLKKRQAKMTGKPVEEPKIDDEDQEPIDEWAISRAQYYAGIKK